MITFTITAIVLFSASAAAPSDVQRPPPLVSVAGTARSAHLLDAETQGKLQAIDARIRDLRPTSTQRALQVVSLVSIGLLIIPVVAIYVGMVSGLVVGAAVGGFPGAVLGLGVGGWMVMQWIPPAVWVAIAVVAVVGGGAFVAEKVIGAQRRLEVEELRRERRALIRGAPRAALAPAQLVTVASF